MTTATKTRPRRTKKKATVKKKRAPNGRKGATKAKTKKPKWALVTFKQLEEWRQKLGLSKSGMAEALKVTNSTYHNWRRGTTVPHPNQQKDILQRIRALETNAAAGKKGTKSKAGKASGKPSRGKRTGGSNSASRNRLSGLDGDGDGSNGSGATSGADNGSRPFGLDVVSPGTHPVSPKVPRVDVASITVAFIQSQKKEVSAGSIISFVRDLREVL